MKVFAYSAVVHAYRLNWPNRQTNFKHRMHHIRTIPLQPLLLILCIFFLFPILAGAEESLDKILEGFEEEKPETSDTQIDKAFEGFDDEPARESAAPESPIEDVLEGFDEEHTPGIETGRQADKPSSVSLDGYTKLGATWNFAHDPPESGETDWRGLSQLRPEARIDLDGKISTAWRVLVGAKLFYDFAYVLKGRDEFSDEVLDEYEREVELAEAFVQGRLNRYIDIKAGRQIVVWGRSDNIRITDVLNPLDLREPGRTDIEDLRLPVTMTRMDGYWAEWNLSAIALHEIRFDKSPTFGHDFFPGQAPLPEDNEPGCCGGDTEWAMALNGIFSGKDISFYWADLFNDAAHVEMPKPGKLTREHARVTLLGAAGNLALGNWLVKGEIAYWQGLKFFNVADEEFQRLDGLLGIEYTGWDETTVSLDWAVRHIVDFDSALKAAPDYAQEDTFESALRISRDYLNETLNVTLLAMIYGSLGQDGALERLTLSYEWTDAISTTLGIVLYQSGDSFRFSRIDDNDRLFLDVKYSF